MLKTAEIIYSIPDIQDMTEKFNSHSKLNISDIVNDNESILNKIGYITYTILTTATPFNKFLFFMWEL